MRYARIWRLAHAAFRSEKAARSWLSRSQHGLDGAIPLEFAKSELGARQVETLITRIQYGTAL
jgi:putative toxin-antitoxin system antitoxin component (TIGR02293 family)